MTTNSFLLPLAMLRKRVGLSQKQLAEALGVTKDSIQNWESGRRDARLSVYQFKVLCRVLQCRPEDLPDEFKNP